MVQRLYTRYAQEVGTLDNGKIYVSKSNIGNMLGLFAGQELKQNSAIVEYTGEDITEEEAKKRLKQNLGSYILRQPLTGNYLDGWSYAQCFRYREDLKEKDHVDPTCSNRLSTKLRNGQIGIAFMANHATRDKNAKIVTVYDEKTASSRTYLVATRDISIDDEIVWNYNNNESRMFNDSVFE